MISKIILVFVILFESLTSYSQRYKRDFSRDSTILLNNIFRTLDGKEFKLANYNKNDICVLFFLHRYD